MMLKIILMLLIVMTGLQIAKQDYDKQEIDGIFILFNLISLIVFISTLHFKIGVILFIYIGLSLFFITTMKLNIDFLYLLVIIFLSLIMNVRRGLLAITTIFPIFITYIIFRKREKIPCMIGLSSSISLLVLCFYL